MSLEFTVCGPNVRVLLNVFASVSRIGDVVFVEGLEDGIEVSAVSPTGNSHIAVRVHRRCFARLDTRRTPPPHNDDAAAASLHGTPADTHDLVAAPPPVHLCVLTKTLTATLLRQHNSSNVQALELRYCTERRSSRGRDAGAEEARDAHGGDDDDDAGDGDRELWRGREEADVVRLHCTYARGITKTFLLRLTDGEPRSVAVDAALYRFEVCGAARTYGQLLGSLPTSANRCSLTLLESGGLELRSAQQPAFPGVDSAARGGGGGGSAAASSGGAVTGRGGAADSSSETKVTAFPKTFTLFRYFDAVAAAGLREAESGPSEVPPTPSPHAPPPPADAPDVTASSDGGGSVLAVPTVTTGFIALPQKSFDVKPVKNAAWLAEQLGTQLHVLLGAAGVPLRLGSITEEEVSQRRHAASADALSEAKARTAGSAVRASSLLTSVTGRRPGHASGSPTAEPAAVSFLVYVAAEDTTAEAARGAPGNPVTRGTVGGAADTSLATAISSAATSPRHSTHTRPSRGAGALAAAPPPRIPHPASSVLVGATRSSMNASLSTAEGDHGRVSGTPYASGAWQEEEEEDARDAQWRTDAPGPVTDVHSVSLSHVADSLSSQPGGGSSHHGGVAGAGAGPLRRPRDSTGTLDSADATPRPSASPLGSVMIVMTGNETPGVGAVRDAVGTVADFAATPSTAVNPSANSRASVPPGVLSNTSAATTLNSMYPLDFEAFVRTYTAAQDAEDGEGEDGAEDPQEAELREFLASCVASLSREPTQS